MIFYFSLPNFCYSLELTEDFVAFIEKVMHRGVLDGLNG